MRTLHLLGAVLTAGTLMLDTACAATYYVAPGGSDTNSGAAEAPWETISNGNRFYTYINDSDGITAIDTVITVDSTVYFCSTTKKTIKIDSEEIVYTSKTDTSFEGCLRGQNGTVAATHADNAIILNCNVPAGLSPGDRIEVQSGTYSQRAYLVEDGSSGNPITYHANGAVVVDGENKGAYIDCFNLYFAQYNVIDGFECRNISDPIYISGGSGIVIRNCICHFTGSGHGIMSDGGNHTAKLCLISNVCYSMATGILLTYADDPVLTGNKSYSNTYYGLQVNACRNAFITNDAYGVDGANSVADVYCYGYYSSMVFRDCKFASPVQFHDNLYITSSEPSRILCQKYNQTSGESRVWGNFIQSSGTLKFNYVDESYAGAGDSNIQKTVYIHNHTNAFIAVTNGGTLEMKGGTNGRPTVVRNGDFIEAKSGAILAMTNVIITGLNVGLKNTGGTVNGAQLTLYNNATGVLYSSGTMNMKNAIIWGSVAPVVGALTITYSDIQGGYAGEGNINLDPLFVSTTPGSEDFHLRSRAGTWNGSGLTRYPSHSPGIDAGNPASDYSHEPVPNGHCVNLGAYGNTGEASRSLQPGTIFVIH